MSPWGTRGAGRAARVSSFVALRQRREGASERVGVAKERGKVLWLRKSE
jgi:hypothetical protein